MNQHYDSYEEEDFLLDDSFVRYCLGTDVVATRFWNNWIELHPEKKTTINNARQLYFLLNGSNTAGQFKKHEEVFRQQFQQLQQSNPVVATTVTRNNRWLKKFILYGSPALLLLFAAAAWLIKKNDAVSKTAASAYTSITGYGERKSILLDDSTRITLNAGTKIIVSPGFNKELREITLDGEALLDVAHNPAKPFIIHTPSMDVKVLGTVLNVKAYSTDKKAETSLIRGLVEVTLKGRQKRTVILHPSEKIVVEKDVVVQAAAQKLPSPTADSSFVIKPLTQSPQDTTVNEILWTRAKIYFDDESLEEIAAVLERNFSVAITLSQDVKGYRYTATFERKSIEEILNALQLSQPFDYTITQNKFIKIAKKIN
ncbi:FecR family protein [Foetidibacter luteolus]|uniref:FecR family protein n=1 Tax=Foetidibacter luteolus TaxID=2608880 RepID=UPI00129BAC74|nr:FecR domain-containing protein [Foetidibacter luteolus]